MAALKWIVLLVCVPAVICDISFLRPRNEKSKVSKPQRLSCPTGYVRNIAGTKCLREAVGYYDSCEEHMQCESAFRVGGMCKDNKCVCEEKYGPYVNGSCWLASALNNECWNSEQCFDGSEYQAASCQHGRCKCNHGFYQRGRSACRRKQKKVGDECLLDWDCDFANGTCVGHKCVQDGKPMVVVGRRERATPSLKRVEGIEIGSECKNNTDCDSIGNSICDVEGTCICNGAHFPTQDKTGCVPEISIECDPSKEGLQVEHAVCRENRWTCPIDRIVSRDNRVCIKLTENIDETCTINEECRLFGPEAECSQAKTCSCKTGSEYKGDKHFCWLGYKDGPVLGTYCKTDSECGTPNSLCNNDLCVCRQHYFELDGQCVKGLGADCQANDDCKSDNAACDQSEHKCACVRDYAAVSDAKCLPKSYYNELCRHDEQCSATVPHSFCNATDVGRRCNCEEGHFLNKEGECQLKKGLDEQCIETDECFAPNTRCKNRRCKCLPAHTLVDGKCVLELGSPCEDNNDCGIPNSLCTDNECVCKTHYYEVDGRCEAGQFASCKVDEDCKHNNTVCNNNVCECPSNFVDGTPENRCMPKSDYHQECKYDVQCSGALANTFCNVIKGAGVCECSETHYFEKGKCKLKKWMDDECQESDECFTPQSQCENKRCQCKPEFPKFYQERCNPSTRSSSTSTRPLFAFVGLILLALKVLY